MSIPEHGVVVFTQDLPQHELRAGDVGTVVHAYPDGKAYEVEFMTETGRTIALETLEPGQVRMLGDGETRHSRSFAAGQTVRFARP